MAANRILEQFGSLVDFVHSGFKYNLQVFPDTLTASAMLFALLFQSPPFAAMSGSIILLNIIHPLIARFFSTFVGKAISRNDSCTGHFPGVSFTRMIQLSSDKKFGDLDNAGWPSYYPVFLGFLTAYASVMPLLYSKELSASPKRNNATIIGLVVLSLVVVTCLVYRIFSGCDSVLSSLVGVLIGGLIGLLIVVFLAWITDRRLTNILALPLIRDKAADGKPIYVCERT